MKGGRAERLAEAIRGELSTMIAQEVKDPRVHAAGLLTVTRVRLSDDLGTAHVAVSFVGADAKTAAKAVDGALAGLARGAGFLRGELARRLNLKRAPELKFDHDTSADHVAKIERLLKGEDE